MNQCPGSSFIGQEGSCRNLQLQQPGSTRRLKSIFACESRRLASFSRDHPWEGHPDSLSSYSYPRSNSRDIKNLSPEYMRLTEAMYTAWGFPFSELKIGRRMKKEKRKRESQNGGKPQRRESAGDLSPFLQDNVSMEKCLFQTFVDQRDSISPVQG